MDQHIDDIFHRLLLLFEEKQVRFNLMRHAPEGRTDLASEIRGHRLECATKAMVVAVHRPKAAIAYFLAVVPGNRLIDFKALKRIYNGDAKLASPEAAGELTRCVMGAVPPLSFDARLNVVFDEHLLHEPEFVFNAGRLDASIFINSADFLKITRPDTGSISKPMR
ncbi:YbaK/EbsC family protein [Nguyenibacter vanlangensis]|uniref:YbaK/EbsC family protein n=1 Tax=Nguyenibacter vanlangensis TaxID=1216886 RepID=A0ABZ3D0V4_9PROT